MRTALYTAVFFLQTAFPVLAYGQDYRQALADEINYCATQDTESVACYKALAQDGFEIIVFFRDVTWVMEEDTLLNPTDEQITRAQRFSSLTDEERYQVTFEYMSTMISSGQSLVFLESADPVEALFFITVAGPIVHEVFTSAVDRIIDNQDSTEHIDMKNLMDETLFPMFSDEVSLLWEMLNIDYPSS